MREASKSLVPLLMCGCGSVGPCHHRSLSVPPPPRLVGVKAFAAALAAAVAALAAAEPPPAACVAALAACVAAPAPVFAALLPLLLEPHAASTLAITGMVRPAANIFAMKCRREIWPALNCSASSATVKSDI